LPGDAEGQRDIVLRLKGADQRDTLPAREFFDGDDPDRPDGFGGGLRCLFFGRQATAEQRR
jgi:hypothetical protein